MKRENIVLCLLNETVIINSRKISEIFFDLKHINYGWDKERCDYNHGPRRNSFFEADVVALFEQLNTLVQVPFAQKVNLKSVDQRYVFYVYDGDRRLKMVVDFMKNNSTVVVTIH